MGCQYYAPTENGADSFTVAMPRLTVGRGTLEEVGERTASLGVKRVALFTDAFLEHGPLVTIVTQSLTRAGIEYSVFSDVRVEPDDASAERGAAFLADARCEAMVSVGGGSVIDTAKAALIIHQHGGQTIDFIAPPVGGGKPISGPLLPHIACPTTSGTGSECTSISVLRLTHLNTKFVIANPCLLPTMAIVDPQVCDSLPANVVASTGFDLCCHALECYTARAFSQHDKVASANARQYIQGANPFSDIVARQALEIVGTYLERGVNDASDQTARDQLMWGATLAGIAFGNSGTHLPHAMSYGITHLMDNITTEGYAMKTPFVPHGISVIVNAPAIFRYTAEATPKRHMQGAHYLQADAKGATDSDAGEVLANRLVQLMRATGMPNGLNGVGFDESQIPALASSSIRQGRAIANAPRDSNLVDLENMYRSALSYW